MTMPVINLHGPRVVQFMGEVVDVTMLKLENDIRVLDKSSSDPITLLVSSWGGKIGMGWSFIDYVKSLIRSPIHTVALGRVDSMAIPIFCIGEKRYCGRYASFGFHYPANQLNGTYNLQEMRNVTRGLERDYDNYLELVAHACGNGTTPKAVDEWKHDELFISAAEALRVGLVHHILGSD